MDLQNEYRTSNKGDATEEERSLYQNTKDGCNLSESSSPEYGYARGVVPTIQHYKEGALDDSSVFFNDKIARNEDGSFYIQESFYSETRLTSLKYVGNVKYSVLKGMSVNEEDTIPKSSGSYFWAQEKAAVYHKPLLEAFLDNYCK